jgi:hypothetical protein
VWVVIGTGARRDPPIPIIAQTAKQVTVTSARPTMAARAQRSTH